MREIANKITRRQIVYELPDAPQVTPPSQRVHVNQRILVGQVQWHHVDAADLGFELSVEQKDHILQRNVFAPALKEEAAAAGAKLRKLLPRRMRKGLVNDGRWLKPDCRAQLQSWVQQRPRIQLLVEHRARLSALLEARSHDAAERLRQLRNRRA